MGGSAVRHGEAPRVAVSIHRPSPALQSYITFFYFVAADGPLSDFLYPEWGNVRFVTKGTWAVHMQGWDEVTPQDGAVSGPTDRPGRISTAGGQVVGFGMTPIGWHRLIEGDASALTNRITPLGDRLGEGMSTLSARLRAEADEERAVAMMEAVIARRLASRSAVGEQVFAIDQALRTRPADVTAFADAAGLSERTLYRLCLKVFGFAPKRLMRLQRFLDTLGQVRSAVGGSVGEAIQGYYDQAHFYRDFRDFMGMSPRAYFGAPRRLMAAAAEAQRRAGVTLSFRLPPPPGGSAAPPSH